MKPVSVLFVCMGNICRSPMAEAVFRHQCEEAGIADLVRIESAGTHSYHLGHEPHPETQSELERRGIEVGDQRSRLVTEADIDSFDLIVAMDRANLDELAGIVTSAAHSDKLSLLLTHADPPIDVDEVPDPYYVGGYDRVFELVDAGCRGLLAELRA